MVTIKRFSHSILGCGVLLAALSTACQSPESNLDPAKPEAAKMEPFEVALDAPLDRPLDTALAESLVEEARAVATAIDAAIAAIDDHRKADAKTQLTTALASLAKLERDRPNIDIAIEIWRQSRAPGAASKTEKAADLEIIDANLVYEEIDLPLAATEIHVLEAEGLLDRGQPVAAKAALVRAVGSFRVIEVVARTPEFQARKRVWAARAAFVNGDRSEAKRLLAEAHYLLAPLAKRHDDAVGREMVIMLLDEIEPLLAALGREHGNDEAGKQPADAFVSIERNVMSLARRAALRTMLSARLETERIALADASMWLEKSETGGLLRSESNTQIGRDLVRAEAALTRATASAPPSAKPNFADIRARIADLIVLDQATPRSPDDLRSKLRGVTFDLHMLMLDLGVPPPVAPTPT